MDFHPKHRWTTSKQSMQPVQGPGPLHTILENNMLEKANKPVKVSIIIPFYNVEKYIRQCLESVTNQTFRDIEIIFIDDSSPDKSAQIIETAAKIDSRIKLIRNHTNEGVGASRNTGIEAATGKYLKIIDSDDFLASDALEVLYNEAEHHQADIVFHDAFSFYSTSKIETYHYPDRHKPLQRMCGHAAWWYLFKRDIIAENYDLRFPVGPHPHEDTTFSFFLITYCKNHQHFQRELIYYRQHEDMIMNQISSTKIKQANMSAALCLKALHKFYKKLPSEKKASRKQAFNDLEDFFVNSLDIFWQLQTTIKRRIIILKLQRFIYRSKITQSNHLLIKICKIPVFRKALAS